MPHGPPPITRTTLPTCRAHYPGGSNECRCRLLPQSHGLPRYSGGSASASSLSRPAQTSLTLRPAGLLNRPKAAFVTRLRPDRLPDQAARQLPKQSTTLRVKSSSTGGSRLRGTLNKAGSPGSCIKQSCRTIPASPPAWVVVPWRPPVCATALAVGRCRAWRVRRRHRP